jgi:hypothetical protein
VWHGYWHVFCCGLNQIRCVASAAGIPAQESGMMMNWLQLSSLQLQWVHEISQSALAGAVAILGLVILLELHSIARLRRGLDGQLKRLFEQIDLIRSEARSSPPSMPLVGVAPQVAAPVKALGRGEARLLAALSAARSRIERGSADNAV